MSLNSFDFVTLPNEQAMSAARIKNFILPVCLSLKRSEKCNKDNIFVHFKFVYHILVDL